MILFTGLLIVFAIIMHLAGDSLYWLRNGLGLVAIVSLVNYFILRPLAFGFQENILPRIINIYSRSIAFALRRKMPAIIFGGTVVLLILSGIILGIKAPKVVFFPVSDPGIPLSAPGQPQSNFPGKGF